MAKKKHISAVISLKDNFSAGLRGVRREQKAFQKEVRQTRKAMDSINKKKMTARLNATQAHKAFAKLKKDTRYIEAKKKLVQTIVAKDMALDKIKKIKTAMNSVGRAIAKPVIMAKDKATSIIKGLGGKLSALAKGVAIPLAIAGGAAGATLKSGMTLEQQQISMNHFMGVGNKGKSQSQINKMSSKYLKDLRNNANATPFETGEVISAGTRALQISNGDTKKAMEKVKLAEDMAALNPGKTISDAMEALADMEMGEYARLTEFGIKATKSDGATPDSVQKQLSSMYSGGAGKLSSSGSGLLSTITGKLKSNVADVGLGMLEPLKPVMSDIIGLIDQATPGMLAFGQSITTGLASGISWLQGQMPTLGPIFTSAFGSMQTIVSTVMPVIGQAITALSPIFTGLLSVASMVLSGISSAVQFAAPIVSSLLSGLTPVFSNVGSALSSLGTIFSSIFSGIMTTVQNAYNFIKPIIEGIGSLVSGISGAVSSGLSWVANKVSGKGKTKKNATGTRYHSGGLTWVGEHGPELVELPSGSKVNTNRESKNIARGGNGGNNFTININGVNMTVEEIINNLIPKLQLALSNL